MPNLYDEEQSPADIAIVGLGPGSLAAALRAAIQGKKVIAFTDREQYIRGQRVKLTSRIVDFLKQHSNPNNLEDQKFWVKYNAEETVQIKDIEKYLYRKIEKHPNVSIVKVDKSAAKKITSLGVGRDSQANFIEIGNDAKYYFRNLLGADGAKHELANLANQCLQTNIQYADSPQQERHPHHAIIQLKLKTGEKAAAIDFKESQII